MAWNKNDKYNWKFKCLLYFMGESSQPHMDQMPQFSIRYIKANYYQHNIELFHLSGDDVTQDAPNIFSHVEKDLRWSEGKVEKPLRLDEENVLAKNEKNLLKHKKKRIFSLFIVGKLKMCVKAHGLHALPLFRSPAREKILQKALNL